MIYDIKVIPTTYAGVNFRSRLEARWAAFFDLCGWKWDYEPFDLDGWAPDFLIKGMTYPVLVEVKPCDIGIRITTEVAAAYEKAINHRCKEHVIFLLGAQPVLNFDFIGSIIHEQPTFASIYWDLSVTDIEGKWREAGNNVQWRPTNDDPYDIGVATRRAIARWLAKARKAA